MIRVILRKDWRLLWPMVAFVTLIQACLEWTGWLLTSSTGDPAASELYPLLTVAWYAAIAVLTVITVQQDGLPGVDQDWLIRPLRRTDLLVAKLSFIALTVLVPMFLLNLTRALATGFALGPSLAAVTYKELYVLAFFIVPVLALGSIASSLTELMMLAAALVGVFATTLSLEALLLGATRCPTCDTGLAWEQHLLQHVGSFIGASAVLGLQYYRRRTEWSRLIAVAGAVALVVVQLPWNAAFAIAERLSALPGAAAAIRIAFVDASSTPSIGAGTGDHPIGAREATRSLLHGDVNDAAEYLRRHVGSKDPPVSVELPLRIDGLATDDLLLVDRSQLRLEDPGNPNQYRAVNAGTFEPASPLTESVSGPRFVHQSVALPSGLYWRIESQETRLEIDYWLTLMRTTARYSVAAEDGTLWAKELGRCTTKVTPDGVSLSCGQLAQEPFCLSIALYGPRGNHNPPVLMCHPDYRPALPIPAELLAIFGVTVPLRDEFGLARYPVDPAELAQSHLVVTVYGAREHFIRSLVVPRLRLSDWYRPA